MFVWMLQTQHILKVQHCSRESALSTSRLSVFIQEWSELNDISHRSWNTRIQSHIFPLNMLIPAVIKSLRVMLKWKHKTEGFCRKTERAISAISNFKVKWLILASEILLQNYREKYCNPSKCSWTTCVEFRVKRTRLFVWDMAHDEMTDLLSPAERLGSFLLLVSF